MYLHVTFTLNTWLTFSKSFSAVQRYVPEAVLLMFGKFQVSPWCHTSPWLPSSSTLVKVIFGLGLLVASQNNVAFDPSRTVRSPLTLVSLTGTKKSNTILLLVIHLQHSAWCWFGIVLYYCYHINTLVHVMLSVGYIS